MDDAGDLAGGMLTPGMDDAGDLAGGMLAPGMDDAGDLVGAGHAPPVTINGLKIRFQYHAEIGFSGAHMVQRIVNFRHREILDVRRDIAT